MSTTAATTLTGITTPPESETELAQAPTPDTASGAITGSGGKATKGDATASSSSSSSEGPAEKELLRKLQSQVEYYFSSENLQNDPYLVSQMNSEKYVPISLVASFPKISALTTDVATVARSVAGSVVCSVDATGTLIKPKSLKFQERNTIILRNLKNAVESDIRNLFEEIGKVVVSCKFEDIGNTWFVTMGSEEIAVESLVALRMGKGFNGVKIIGGIKSKSVARSSFGTKAVDAPAFVPSSMKGSGGGGGGGGGGKGKQQNASDGSAGQPKSLMSVAGAVGSRQGVA